MLKEKLKMMNGVLENGNYQLGQFQFAVLVLSRVWGSARPNKKLSQRGKNFQELKICGHGTILALPFFAAFRNFHISICSQIVDKLRLTRYYKGNPNTLPRRCNHDRCNLRPLFI